MRQCKLCGKGSVMRGKRRLLRGHHNPVAYSRKYPNLQYVSIAGTRALICSTCRRTLSKTVKKSEVK